MGVPLVIIHFNGIFLINHPFLGSSILEPPHVCFHDTAADDIASTFLWFCRRTTTDLDVVLEAQMQAWCRAGRCPIDADKPNPTVQIFYHIIYIYMIVVYQCISWTTIWRSCSLRDMYTSPWSMQFRPSFISIRKYVLKYQSRQDLESSCLLTTWQVAHV